MCWLTEIVERQRWLDSSKGFPTHQSCLMRLEKPLKRCFLEFDTRLRQPWSTSSMRYCSITKLALLLDEHEDVTNEKRETPKRISIWNFLVRRNSQPTAQRINVIAWDVFSAVAHLVVCREVSLTVCSKRSVSALQQFGYNLQKELNVKNLHETLIQWRH